MPTLEVLTREEMCLEVTAVAPASRIAFPGEGLGTMLEGTAVAPMPLKVAGEITALEVMGLGLTAVAPVALTVLVEGEAMDHTALPAASLRLPMLLRVLETSLRIHPP